MSLCKEGDIHLFGVVGYPLSHSLSPVLHNWAFKKASLPHVYLLWEISPSNLPAFMVCVRTLKIRGVSVTLPFKERIIPYLDVLTEDAIRVGAVNHLFWEDNRLCGNNTDVEGFLSPLREIEIDSALVLGTGGAALAVIWGLLKKGVKRIFVAGRNLKRLSYLRDRFGISPVEWDKRSQVRAFLLINATPLGMSSYELSLPFPKDALHHFSFVYDIVYNPIDTPLIIAAKKEGCRVIDGLSMFIQQALLQFEKWTTQTFSTSEARSLLTKKISS